MIGHWKYFISIWDIQLSYDYDYDDVDDNQLSYDDDDYDVNDDLIGPGKFWFFIAEDKESSHCPPVKDPNGEAAKISGLENIRIEKISGLERYWDWNNISIRTI